MKLIYIDESGTFNDNLTAKEAKINRRKSLYFVLSALIVDLEDWEKVFGRFKALRTDLRHNYKVKKSDQIHAYELIGGTKVWKHIKYRHLTTPKRQKLLKYLLTNYAEWSEIDVISVVINKLSDFPSIQPETARTRAYENLFNRIDKTYVENGSDDEKYMVINDGQEDVDIIKLLRRLRAFNTIRMTSGTSLDIKIKGLKEDPLFKTSKHSYFLQCIDHIAYSTLHLFDERLNTGIGHDLLLSNLYKNKGVAAVHRETATDLPGVVIVPKMSTEQVSAIRRKSLGV